MTEVVNSLKFLAVFDVSKRVRAPICVRIPTLYDFRYIGTLSCCRGFRVFRNVKVGKELQETQHNNHQPLTVRTDTEAFTRSTPKSTLNRARNVMAYIDIGVNVVPGFRCTIRFFRSQGLMDISWYRRVRIAFSDL